ncbi:MAG: ABC transporter substrate-binding protein [Elusimicrobiota bacterium]|nr:ABC transporter substrate-binding protein [Elusimicrobiota bacterium]
MKNIKCELGNFLKLCAAALCLCGFSSPAQARRVVSLMPSYTEIIFELGAEKDLVGVSNFCNWPPGAGKIEKTGDYLRPNIEKIYSLKPDTVFAGAWADASSSKQLSSMGVKVVSLSEEKSAADIFATVRLIAAELGRRREGERLVKKLSALMPHEPPAKPLKVYLEADAGGWTAGGQSFLSDAVRLAGGRNIFGGEKRGYFQASWEEVLLLDPEAVILLSGTEEEFLARPMAKGLAAAKAGRIITGLDRDAFSRPGPRLFSEIKKLRGLLYGKK